MLKSSLCDYIGAYRLAKETRAIPNTAVTGEAANNTN